MAVTPSFSGPVQPFSRKHARLRPVAGSVRLQGGFWGERQTRNREVSIPHGTAMLNESGNLDNFRLAAGMSSGDYHLPVFMDSDLYKVLEAIAWERQHGAEPAHEAFFREAAELVQRAQLEDGYLNTYYQAAKPGKRLSEPAMGHELYCAGHLLQAAVAEARSSGQPLLAPVAARLARYLVPAMASRPNFVPGHPEIEMALVELYREAVAQKGAWDGRYLGKAEAQGCAGAHDLLALAEDLAGRRGKSTLSFGSFDAEYFQDDVELVKADKVRGHAVRALYLLSGAVDLFIETGRRELLDACSAQWDDMVSSKTYLTGGVGSRHKDEAFGEPFELPPDRAYCETCAAVASIMWNWRMTLATGHARYAELAERALYNGFLAGWGLDGRSYFYVNPLQSRQGSARQRWYRVACCPPNVMRLLASIEHYLVTQDDWGVQLHQFAAVAVSARFPGASFDFVVETGYPWEGWVVVRVEQAPPRQVDLALRVPSWAGGSSLQLNGKGLHEAVPATDGYLHVKRDWQSGDELTLWFPMAPRIVRPDPRVEAVRGCVALERGPFVYCFEPDPSANNRSQLAGLLPGRPVRERSSQVSTETVTELICEARDVELREGGRWPYYPYSEAPRQLEGTGPPFEASAIPYYAWANRGPASMRVWVPALEG